MIREYSNRLSRIIDKLKSSGKPIEDIYCCFQVLRRLPERFQPLVQYLLMDSSDKFTYTEIVLHLLAEEARIELRKRNTEDQNTDVQYVSSKNSSKGTTFNRHTPNKNLSHRNFVSSPAPKLRVIC